MNGCECRMSRSKNLVALIKDSQQGYRLRDKIMYCHILGSFIELLDFTYNCDFSSDQNH